MRITRYPFGAYPRKPYSQQLNDSLKGFVSPPDDPVAWIQNAFGFTADAKQAEILRSDALRLILLTARQVGKSTIAALRALYLALRYRNSLILMISPVGSQAGEILAKATFFAAELGIRVRGDGVNRQSLLESERRTFGDLYVAQEYNCQFIAAGLQLLNRSQIKEATVEALPEVHFRLREKTRIYLGLDIGKRQDHTAIAVLELRWAYARGTTSPKRFPRIQRWSCAMPRDWRSIRKRRRSRSWSARRCSGLPRVTGSHRGSISYSSTPPASATR